MHLDLITWEAALRPPIPFHSVVFLVQKALFARHLQWAASCALDQTSHPCPDLRSLQTAKRRGASALPTSRAAAGVCPGVKCSHTLSNTIGTDSGPQHTGNFTCKPVQTPLTGWQLTLFLSLAIVGFQASGVTHAESGLELSLFMQSAFRGHIRPCPSFFAV